MADNQETRIAALEAKVQELDALVSLALRLLAVEKPISAVMERYGATEAEDLAVHALLDDVAKRAEQGGMYAPSFGGFVGELFERFPGVREQGVCGAVARHAQSRSRQLSQAPCVCRCSGLAEMDLKRLGPYDILSPLGAGGCGEVYKARDTRLDSHSSHQYSAGAIRPATCSSATTSNS